MKELLKKLAIAGAGLTLIAGIALANEVGNSNTGYNSDNDASIEEENEVEVENDNDAHIRNKIEGEAETGENEANKNTGDGDVKTGDADASVDITNDANNNVTDGLCCPGADGDNVVTNDTTGAESDNDAWIHEENEVEVENENDAWICNDIELEAETGENEANMNTGDGSVDSGDASVDISIDNMVNSNQTSFED